VNSDGTVSRQKKEVRSLHVRRGKGEADCRGDDENHMCDGWY
jgi:hypothetical protein